MEITKVQQWVASSLLFTVGMIPTVTMAWYSAQSEHLRETGNPTGLWVMGGVTGVLTIGGCLLIHQRSALSPWLLFGLVPAAVSAYFVF